MKIDKKKLIELLIDKTGMDRKEVEAQMDQLIDRILDASERGKALEINEFGLFYFDQNNELKFEPSEELSTEISFKYAGMKPVELKPKRNTGIPPELGDSEPSDSKKESQNENEIVQQQKSSHQEKTKTTAVPTPKKPALTKSKAGATYRKPVTRKKDRSFVWATLAFLLVLVIGAAVYYFMQSQETEQFTDTQQQASEQQFQEADPLPELSISEDAIVSDDLSSENPVSNDAITEQRESDEVQLSQEPELPLYGLTGGWNSSINNLYSIVVHSFYTESRANEVASGLENDGYRTIVSDRVVNDREVWRVSIGQYQTIDEAQNGAATLPEPYNTGTFIQRIQQ